MNTAKNLILSIVLFSISTQFFYASDVIKTIPLFSRPPNNFNSFEKLNDGVLASGSDIYFRLHINSSEYIDGDKNKQFFVFISFKYESGLVKADHLLSSIEYQAYLGNRLVENRSISCSNPEAVSLMNEIDRSEIFNLTGVQQASWLPSGGRLIVAERRDSNGIVNIIRSEESSHPAKYLINYLKNNFIKSL